jgi:carboxymethylenebutenolidase
MSEQGIETTVLEVARPGGDGNRKPMAAFLARPGGAGPWPGVLVIHEAFGLNDNIRDVTRRFARAGYVGLAIDLFSGANRAMCLARAFGGIFVKPLQSGTLRELQAAVKTLAAQPDVDAGRMGAIGFCMGGSYALQLACVDGDVRAASTFYGMNPRPMEAFRRACPIVGSYPQHDFTASGGRKLDATLLDFKIEHDIKVYPNTRHSFFNEHGAMYDAAAAEDAWTRTLAFFAEHLQPR